MIFMNCSIRFQGIICILLILSAACSGQHNNKASISEEKDHVSSGLSLRLAGRDCRYLVDSGNKPFFWLGDAAWSMIAQLNREDADFYLDDRQEKGFTVLLSSLIEHKFCSNPPANYYGELPFTGRPFSTPNEKYFEHAEYVISSAARRNIVILLAPLYLGYGCGDEGWCTEVKDASPSELYSYGKYIGERFKGHSNIVWIIGGDTDPTVVKDKVLEMIRGIRENDTIHLFSAHNQPESMAITPWQDESWLTVNNVYSYDSVLYTHFKTAFQIKPVKPFYLCESAYENEHSSTPRQLRTQAYQAMLSGAMGYIFGNCPIWHFGSYEKWCNLTDWKKELNNTGSRSMYYFQKLFRSRPWYSLIPDFEHVVITSGFGKWGFRDYVTASLTADANTLIAYLPSARSLTINADKINGKKAICWWYDPSTGNAYKVATFNSKGYREFTPPHDGDWVLVIDNAAKKFSEPGNTGKE
jgi:hypothetical protein